MAFNVNRRNRGWAASVVSGLRWIRHMTVPMATIVTLLAPGTAGAAPVVQWSRLALPDSVASLGFSGVSCTARTWCMLVGSGGNEVYSLPAAATWDRGIWTPLHVPGRHSHSAELSDGNWLAAVSCTTGRECMAVGSYEEHPCGGDGCYMTGEPWVERWTGKRWMTERIPLPAGGAAVGEGNIDNYLNSVWCSSATQCTAVGTTIAPGYSGMLIERWERGHWTLQLAAVPPSGVGELLGVDCPSSRSCVAVGASQGYPSDTLVERWDGTRWSVQTTPNPPGLIQPRLHSVSCWSQAACTAVGEAFPPVGAGGAFASAAPALVERWDGRDWAMEAVPKPATAVRAVLNGVSCPSRGFCNAVGLIEKQEHPETPATVQGALSVHWDALRWSLDRVPVPLDDTESELSGVSCTSASACVAVGASDPDVGHTLVEQWVTPSATPGGIPPGCVRAPFTAHVSGIAISTVTWSLDGKRIKGKTVRPGARYIATIAPRAGAHHLAIHVTFVASAQSPAHTFHRTVSGCATPTPQFTG